MTRSIDVQFGGRTITVTPLQTQTECAELKARWMELRYLWMARAQKAAAAHVTSIVSYEVDELVSLFELALPRVGVPWAELLSQHATHVEISNLCWTIVEVDNPAFTRPANWWVPR